MSTWSTHIHERSGVFAFTGQSGRYQQHFPASIRRLSFTNRRIIPLIWLHVPFKDFHRHAGRRRQFGSTPSTLVFFGHYIMENLYLFWQHLYGVYNCLRIIIGGNSIGMIITIICLPEYIGLDLQRKTTSILLREASGKQDTLESGVEGQA